MLRIEKWLPGRGLESLVTNLHNVLILFGLLIDVSVSPEGSYSVFWLVLL